MERHLLLLDNGDKIYTRSFKRAIQKDVVDILQIERSFDNGETWIVVDFNAYACVD